MRKILDWITDTYPGMVIAIILTALIYTFFVSFVVETKKGSEPLKEFKDGIQNHLVWDIKGQCYFVRPDDDITVYLIRVVDCDKK